MLTVKLFTFNPFYENTYILYDETNECIIIDPGCYSDEEKKNLVHFIEENKLIPKKLINTHCHIDHVFGNKFVSEKYKLDLEMHKLELFNLNRVKEVSEMYGLLLEESPRPKIFLEEGSKIKLGNSELEIIFTPGHAPGEICLLNRKEKILISGDVLFEGSIGRYDFPGCSYEDLMDSLKNKLMKLPDYIKVFPGHGPDTTIGQERRTNPFLI